MDIIDFRFVVVDDEDEDVGRAGDESEDCSDGLDCEFEVTDDDEAIVLMNVFFIYKK